MRFIGKAKRHCKLKKNYTDQHIEHDIHCFVKKKLYRIINNLKELEKEIVIEKK